MANPEESVPPSRLEVLVIRGIGVVAHGSDTMACYAAVLTPEPGCMSSSGQNIICDRVLRFYGASTALKSHRPIAEGETVSLQKQSDDAFQLLVGQDVYALRAPEGKRMDVKWGDFSSMDNRSSADRRQAINKYVMSVLRKPL